MTSPRTGMPAAAETLLMGCRGMEVLAIIPAFGGARRLLDLLAGKPLIGHTIERARRAMTVGRLVVATDDPEIAAVSRQYGAAVVWQTAEIGGEMPVPESALLHTLEYLRRTEGYDPAVLVLLQSTAPLTLPEDMDGAVRTLLEQNADSVVTVTPFPHLLWKRNKRGEGVGVNHDHARRPLHKDPEPQFLETGAVYAVRAGGFREAKRRLFGKTALHVMPPDRCLRIDGPADLDIAEVLIKRQQQPLNLQSLPDGIAAVIFDFDGVFTDNKVIVSQDGREAVVCDRGDGWGLAQLKRLGVPILVLSTEENPVVQARCDKLGLSCLQGIREKLDALTAWLKAHELDMGRVVYVGNDVNDLSCMRAVGCGVAVGNSHPLVLAAARIVLSSSGGQGAIREIAELIEQKWEVRNRND